MTWSRTISGKGAGRAGACVLVLSSALTTGCVSFTSVKHAADVGTQLSTHEGALDMSPALCRMTTTTADFVKDCDVLQKDVEAWRRVNQVMVGYAKALSAMADDSKDKSYTDELATAIGAFGSIGPISTDVTGGVSSGADALIHVIIGAWRREELRSTIVANDAHVQKIADGMQRYVDVVAKVDDSILAQYRTTIASLDAGGALELYPLVAAASTTYHHASMPVAAERQELAKYNLAVKAFAKAHGDLKNDIEKVGDWARDREVAQVIVNDVVKIAQGVSKLLAPPTTTKN